ncbi:MAG: 4-hydroxy-tetrahydrodipicolinate reductase [Mycoplasmatales bacterium]
MKIILHGFGKMGQKIEEIITQKYPQIKVMAIVDFKNSKQQVEQNETVKKYQSLVELSEHISLNEVDLILDFSNSQAIDSLLDFLFQTKMKAVIATTGLTQMQLTKITELSKQAAIFQSYNTSYGLYWLNKLIEVSNQVFTADFDVAILDKHHNQKVDRPSGTAKLLESKIEHSEVEIKDFRIGGIYGEHSVFYASDSEVIELKHTALNRDVFAYGAIRAALTLATKEAGYYTLENIYE